MSQSTEENSKDESENRTKLVSDARPAKDRRNRKDKLKPLAKVVIRRLPPSMTEEKFLKQIDPIPEHDYFYFVPADCSLGQMASSRAYINFCNQNDIFLFKDRFDGYVFVDTKGAEYPAVVEFAPFQGLPKTKSRKKDHKANTTENDPHYIRFLESLKKEEEADGKGEMKMEYSFKIKDDQKITSTPLLEYLANVKQERRDERKRKTDDRKKQREEERQRKRNQVAKAIPRPIEEDPKEDDDGIIVRVIKSRPLDRDRNKKESKDKDKVKRSEEAERHRREEQRKKKENREARRREERERYKKERDERQAGTSANNKETQNKDNSNKDGQRSKPNVKDDKEKVKKYSESRRERRERVSAEAAKTENQPGKASQSKKAENTNKNNSNINRASGKKNDEQPPDDRASNNTSPEAREFVSQNSQDGSKSSYNDKYNKEKAAIRNIRNKDRPSLQIYQPGKRRSSNPSLPTNSTSQQSEPSSPTPSESKKSIDGSSNNIQQQLQAAVQNLRLSDCGDTKNSSSEIKNKTNERKVSRYSEKRNKAKEKRDSAAVDNCSILPQNAVNQNFDNQS